MRCCALLLLAACDPGFRIVADVRDDAGPVAGAAIRIDCPAPHLCSSFPFATDASGRVDETTLGPCCTRDSVLTVQADGHAPASFVVEDVCAGWTTQRFVFGPHNRCYEMRVAARLQRTAP